MEVVVIRGNIDRGIKTLKRKLSKDGIKAARKLRSIAKAFREAERGRARG